MAHGYPRVFHLRVSFFERLSSVNFALKDRTKNELKKKNSSNNKITIGCLLEKQYQGLC